MQPSFFQYAKKSVIAGFLAAVPTFIGFNYSGWVDGTEAFEWRSVAAAAIAAFVAGVGTFYATNFPKPTPGS